MRILNLMNDQKIDFNSVSLTNSTPITLEIFDMTHKDLEVISEKFNIDLIDLEDVFDANERPRVDIDPINN